jgi:hypothetical protein
MTTESPVPFSRKQIFPRMVCRNTANRKSLLVKDFSHKGLGDFAPGIMDDGSTIHDYEIEQTARRFQGGR